MRASPACSIEAGAELIRTQVAPETDAFTFAQIAGHTGVTVKTENLSGVTSANQMFTSCGSLETIYATSFSNTGLSGSLMFNSCNRLVGGTDGFVPSTTSSASVCKLGADRDIGKIDKTIRRAIKAERIHPELLDRIARKLDVYPPYHAGRYAWTLKLSIMDEEGVCDYWRDTYLDPKHFVSLCFANSIEDVLRNYFLRFAAYQNVVLRCLGNEVTPSLEASTSRNNEMVKFGSDTPKFNHLSGRLVSRKKSDNQDDR